jgi:hypothetical protein
MARPRRASERRNAEASKRGGPGEASHLPAYFLSLSLENVRCFGPKQTLDLSDGNGKPARWTVILGSNGTGKTTLLQALVAFEQLPSDRTGVTLSARFFNRAWYNPQNFPRGKKRGKVWWGVQLGASRVLAAPPDRVLEFRFRIDPDGKGYDPCYSPVPDDFELSPWCCAYGAGRRVGAASSSGPGPADPTAGLFSDNADLRNPEEWLPRLDDAATKPSRIQGRKRGRRSQVKELLLGILPEVEDVRLTSPNGPHPTPRVEFKTPYGWVPLRQLGYGHQTLITWVTDLATRMVERHPDSPNPLAEPAVVAVDEIDLHLHPLGQRKLMSFLSERFPNTQFIATAHSPLVAQAAADANLAVLRREGDHVVIDNDVDNSRGWRTDQTLTGDLFGLESDLLTSERRPSRRPSSKK